MATTTVSLEDFESDPESICGKTADGPVYIERPGRSSLVLISLEEYRKLPGVLANVAHMLPASLGFGEIESEPPRFDDVRQHDVHSSD